MSRCSIIYIMKFSINEQSPLLERKGPSKRRCQVVVIYMLQTNT
jgi:hypothetical protein